MSPALVIGHPTTLVVSLLLIPSILLLAVILPNNKFLPLASLAGIFYLFPIVLPITKGNVVKTFIIGLVSLIVGLYFVTNIAEAFTMAANFVSEQHPEDASVRIPDGFSSGAALDFASSILCWVTYHLFASIKGIVGIFVSILFLAGLIRWNYKKNNSDNHL
jgi:PTS system galactitol-specific IIC component